MGRGVCSNATIRRITDLGIYLGVTASVVSGLLIAYLRPGPELTGEVRGFRTTNAERYD